MPFCGYLCVPLKPGFRLGLLPSESQRPCANSEAVGVICGVFFGMRLLSILDLNLQLERGDERSVPF